jgi:pectinesterase
MRYFGISAALTLSAASAYAHEAALELYVGGEHTTHESVSAALADVPEGDSPVTIHIAPGHYYEKLVVTRPNIHFKGDAKSPPVIYFDAYAGLTMPGSTQTYGTWRSATVTVRAPDVRFTHTNIHNTYDYPSNDALEKSDPRKQRGSQAVALMLDQGSDKFLFSSGELKGYQDTLFALAGRSVFQNSIISGHVDFIFGAGTALFVNNTIVTEPRAHPMKTIGYLTAPSTDINTPYGLVFWNNRLTAKPGVKPNTMGLGRPWHPTTTFPDGRYADPNAIGQSIFIANWMGSHIQQEPWHPMGGTAKEGGKTYFQPEDARFYEFASCGPGADKNETRRQLTDEQALHYKPVNVLGDWQPDVELTVSFQCPL